jgi:hypothetical protein
MKIVFGWETLFSSLGHMEANFSLKIQKQHGKVSKSSTNNVIYSTNVQNINLKYLVFLC